MKPIRIVELARIDLLLKNAVRGTWLYNIDFMKPFCLLREPTFICTADAVYRCSSSLVDYRAFADILSYLERDLSSVKLIVNNAHIIVIAIANIKKISRDCFY